MNEPLPAELRELEDMLSSLVPSAMPRESATRMTQAVESELAAMQPAQEGLDELEKHLGEIAPASMRTDVLSRMVKAMDSWHETVPEQEKIISFSGRAEEKAAPRAKSGGMLSAAAAVALLGAVTALVMPHIFPEKTGTPAMAGVADTSPGGVTPPVSHAGPKDAWLVPGALSHKVVNTTDRGVLMANDQTPHRCIRLDGLKTIKLEDEDGREIIIERPSVRYVLIPVETN